MSRTPKSPKPRTSVCRGCGVTFSYTSRGRNKFWCGEVCILVHYKEASRNYKLAPTMTAYRVPYPSNAKIAKAYHGTRYDCIDYSSEPQPSDATAEL